LFRVRSLGHNLSMTTGTPGDPERAGEAFDISRLLIPLDAEEAMHALARFKDAPRPESPGAVPPPVEL
jgi:hypothetical protein